MGKRRRLMIFFLLAAVAVAAMIFCFSAQNGDDSTAMSDGVAQAQLSIFGMKLTGFSYETQRVLTGIIRKLAHLSEYALLGFCLAGFYRLRFIERPVKLAARLSLLTGALYAASDEVHQLFVPGRAAMALDVVIDSVGVALGIWLLLRLFRRRSIDG